MPGPRIIQKRLRRQPLLAEEENIKGGKPAAARPANERIVELMNEIDEVIRGQKPRETPQEAWGKKEWAGLGEMNSKDICRRASIKAGRGLRPDEVEQKFVSSIREELGGRDPNKIDANELYGIISKALKRTMDWD